MNLILLFSIVFGTIYILIWVYLIYTIISMITGAPFVPTKMKNVRKMIEISGLKQGEQMVDFGSGDGRIIFVAAQTGAQCVGVEISPFMYWWSKIRLKRLGLKNAQIIRTNMWNIHLSDVDVLTLFLIPHKMKKLYKKIMREMKPGSRVISYAFTFPNWDFTEKYDNIYLYIV